MEKIRLQKYFTDCGVLSRRAAEREIEAGRVKLNGQIAKIGDKVMPGVDKVVWNGRGIVFKDRVAKRVIALNKPRGYVCTASDEKGRKVVTELVEDAGGRLYPIGRLDMQSEGLLLLTDDGEFANLMMHPKHHIPKEYKVSVKGKEFGIRNLTLTKYFIQEYLFCIVVFDLNSKFSLQTNDIKIAVTLQLVHSIKETEF